ncbi:hypothetical protein D3C80_1430590 [compost metagenome]
MTFCSQMNNCIGIVFLKKTGYKCSITDIPFLKNIIRGLFNIMQICKITGIGKLIQVHNSVPGIVFYKASYHMGADKACPASDDDSFRHYLYVIT